MVTADEIENAPNRETLTKLRGTLRSSRTRKMKDLLALRNRTRNFDVNADDFDEKELARLYADEEEFEGVIEGLTRLIDRASARISSFMNESFDPTSTENPSPTPMDSALLPRSPDTDSLSTLVSALTSALQKEPDLRIRISDVNGLSVASKALKDPYLLPAHFKRVEQLFLASGFATLSDNKFLPEPDPEVYLVEKLLETLVDHDRVAAEANSVVDEVGGDWHRVKAVLLDKFSRPDEVRRELRRRVDVRQLRILASSISPADTPTTKASDNVHFINAILRCLPSDIYSSLVQQVTQTARILRPGTASKEWQLRLPFDGKADDVTILSILSDICQSFTVVSDSRKASRPQDREQPSKDIRDRVLFTGDAASTSKHKKEYREVMTWARSQPYVLFVTGLGVGKLESAPANSPGLGAANEVKFLVSRRGQKYALLAFDSRTSGEVAATEGFTDRKLYTRPAACNAAASAEIDALSTGSKQPLSDGLAQNGSNALVDHDSIDSIRLRSEPHGAQQQRHLSEVTLQLRLRQSEETLQLHGIVDTGASASYLVSPDPLARLPFSVSCADNPTRVQLADGRCIDVNSTIRLSVSTLDINQRVSLSESGLETPITSSGSCLSANPVGRHPATMPPISLYGSEPLPDAQAGETIQVISDEPWDNQLFYGDDATTARVDSSQFTLLPPSSVLTKPVVIRLPPRTETSLFEIWNSIAAKGWLDSSSGGSYRTRIRRLLPSERLDVPGQVYVAELYLPALSVPRVAVGDYALAMYRRLSSALQKSYAELVGDFVSKGFWAEAPPSNGGQSPSVPAANVFLVTNKSSSQPPSKSRLVCDLRPINSASPIAAVHGGPGLADVLCSIRMTAPMALATADIKSAFYSIRLSPESGTPAISIKTAVGNYITARVSFGVSGYRCSDVATDTWLHDYFDDLVIAGLPVAVAHNLCQPLRFLFLGGFLPQEKKLAVATVPRSVEEIQAVFAECGMDVSIGSAVSIFNTDFVYSSRVGRPILTTDCRRALRVGRALLFFQKEPPLTQKLSKKAFFGISGLLSFDCAKLHARARLLADTLRSLVGGCFATVDWDCVCDLASMCDDYKLAYLELVRWGREICEAESVPCSHAVMVRTNESQPIKLEVCSDASLFGGGFAIYSDGQLIYEDAVRFSRSQTLHSSNRRELRLCLLALRKVAEIVEYCAKSACKKRRGVVPLEVCFRCDNRPSLAWIQSGSLKLQSSKVLERRALVRLVDAIGSELDVIREHSSLSLDFIPGASNTHADSLSRLLDRPVEDAGGRCLGEVLIPRKGGGVLDTHEVLEGQCCTIFEASQSTDGWFSPEDIFTGGSTDDVDHDFLRLAADSCCLLRDESLEYEMGPARQPFSGAIVGGTCGSTSLLMTTLTTVDTIYSVRDCPGSLGPDLCRVTSAADVQCEPVIEGIARGCCDLDSALWRLRFLRFIIQSWRSLSSTPPGPPAEELYFDPSECYDRTNLAVAARSAQRLMFEVTPGHSPPSYLGDRLPQDGGPLQRLICKECPEVYVFRSGLPSGEPVLTFHRPRVAAVFRRLVVFDAHRRSLHSGLSGTLASVDHFHLSAIVSVARDVIAGCTACRIAHAIRGWHCPPGCGEGELSAEEMSNYPPYTFATADVVALGDGVKAVSVRCRFSRHCIWRDLPSGVESTANVVAALIRIQAITGGMKILWVDCASYFRSREFRESTWNKMSTTVRLLPRHAPWTGSHERHHRTMLNYLRMVTRNSAGRVKLLSSVDRETLYDRVALTHNSMPLGGYIVSGPELRYMCPDLLAYGHVRAIGASAAIKLEVPHLPYKVCKQSRQVYISEVWSRIKKANLDVRPRLRAAYDDLDPGRTVLVFVPTARKLALPFVIAHVVRRVNHRVEHCYNVVPFSRDPKDYVPLAQGPSLIDMPLDVWVDDPSGHGDWYRGVVVDQSGTLEVLVRWENGDPEEWLDLNTETWRPSYADGDDSP
ncbi:hypothetical protein FOL46_009983 [Perkinsus olseni]|uniref:Uncharacterized protein n=1 Tax=Perkinsus olseni TaxID=32597 RepID=A0A7J6KYF1_PEROL|nr:hypothetical protein FOL46_009983 [Perkinsus olseni]